MALAPEQTGIGIRRHFTTAGRPPLRRGRVGAARRPHHQLPRRRGRLRAARRRVPGRLVAERHQHRRPEVLPGHARHARARVVAAAGRRPGGRHHHRRGACEDGYFVDDDEAETFRAELKHLIVTQKAAFNSPVWFNIGVHGRAAAGVGLLHPRRRRHDGLDPQLVRRGGHDLQGRLGRRASTCRSIRSSSELLKGGGTASRPGQLHARRRRVGRHHQVGRQDPARRQDGHPQRRPPRRRGVHLVQGHRGAQGPGAARRRLRHGPRRQGQPLDPVPERQQLGAGHRRVHAGRRRRRRLAPPGRHRPARSSRPCKARDLMRQIAQAAWECADPGMQFDTTINRWHTARQHRPHQRLATRAREYMHLDNSACNLAQLNLLKFLDDDGTFDVEGFKARRRGRVHRPGDPRRQRRLPDRADRRERPALPPARPRLRQPRRPADGARACPTTPTRAGPGPRPSPRS